FRDPRAAQRPLWTEPYFDRGGGDQWMATYSAPFYREVAGRRVFAGGATADVYLESFRTLVGRVRVPPGSYTLLRSRQGTVMAASPPKAAEDPRARQTAERVAGRGSGFEAASAGAPGWLAYAPVSGAGWTIAEFFPEAVLMEPVVRLEALLCGI